MVLGTQSRDLLISSRTSLLPTVASAKTSSKPATLNRGDVTAEEKERLEELDELFPQPHATAAPAAEQIDPAAAGASATSGLLSVVVILLIPVVFLSGAIVFGRLYPEGVALLPHCTITAGMIAAPAYTLTGLLSPFVRMFDIGWTEQLNAAVAVASSLWAGAALPFLLTGNDIDRGTEDGTVFVGLVLGTLLTVVADAASPILARLWAGLWDERSRKPPASASATVEIDGFTNSVAQGVFTNVYYTLYRMTVAANAEEQAGVVQWAAMTLLLQALLVLIAFIISEGRGFGAHKGPVGSAISFGCIVGMVLQSIFCHRVFFLGGQKRECESLHMVSSVVVVLQYK